MKRRSDRDAFLRMVAAINEALCAEAKHRWEHEDWIDRERLVVACEANRWANSHDGWRCVTVEDVERVEGQAVGHSDYAAKLALYVAELVISSPDPSEER